MSTSALCCLLAHFALLLFSRSPLSIVALGTALFIIPVYYVMNTLLAIIGGLIYFEAYREVIELMASNREFLNECC